MYLLTCYHRLPEKSIKSDDILFIFVIINHRQHQKHRKKGIIYFQFFLTMNSSHKNESPPLNTGVGMCVKITQKKENVTSITQNNIKTLNIKH